MSTQNDDARAFEYWPSKDERRIVGVLRSPEVDAMTDEELIRQDQERENPNAREETRLVRRERNGHRSTAVVKRTAETDAMTDEEIIAELEEWARGGQRHLRAVDEPE